MDKNIQTLSQTSNDILDYNVRPTLWQKVGKSTNPGQ